MSELAEDIRFGMMNILKEEETKTDLDNLVVLSRVGLKVASSSSSELDADATSASSTALIDLGLRLSEATNHGALREIILHNSSGYSILMAIDEEYILFGGLSNVYRIGFYLGYLQELTKKLSVIITGGVITEQSLFIKEQELSKAKDYKEAETISAKSTLLPSIEQDKAAMDDLLNYLDEWDQEEKEMMGIEPFEDLEENNIVSIPESMTVGLPKENKTTPVSKEKISSAVQTTDEKFKVYGDEIPPVPLTDYTPIDVEDEVASTTEYDEKLPSEMISPAIKESSPLPTNSLKKKEFPPLDQLPSFDELSIPDFNSQAASEYDTDFILEEESEALDSVLKDLGWEEED